jgi:hypothetical protein
MDGGPRRKSCDSCRRCRSTNAIGKQWNSTSKLGPQPRRAATLRSFSRSSESEESSFKKSLQPCQRRKSTVTLKNKLLTRKTTSSTIISWITTSTSMETSKMTQKWLIRKTKVWPRTLSLNQFQANQAHPIKLKMTSIRSPQKPTTSRFNRRIQI